MPPGFHTVSVEQGKADRLANTQTRTAVSVIQRRQGLPRPAHPDPRLPASVDSELLGANHHDRRCLLESNTEPRKTNRLDDL